MLYRYTAHQLAMQSGKCSIHTVTSATGRATGQAAFSGAVIIIAAAIRRWPFHYSTLPPPTYACRIRAVKNAHD